MFEEIFGHKFAVLVDKLINTIDKKENQIIIDDIENNRDKIFEPDENSKFVIQPRLMDAIELLTLDEDNND